MFRSVALVLIAVALCTYCANAFADEPNDQNEVKVYWKDGLRFDAPNAKLKIGGRLLADYSFYDRDSSFEDAIGQEWHSGFEFRSARLSAEGVMWKHAAFKTEFDFAHGDVEFKDVYVGMVDMDECWGEWFPDIQIGHFKEPFSLEALESNRYLTFLERALPVEAFAPQRNTGIGAFRDFYGSRGTVALGVFGHDVEEDGDGSWHPDDTQGGYDLTGRVTFLPWAPQDSRFVHVGASASWQSDFSEARYRSRPENHFGPRVVDTGIFDADEALVLAGEAAFGYDSFHLQGEYITSIVSSDLANDPVLWGWYVEASWMFGGQRSFKRERAVFDKVNIGSADFGAFELAARYSYLDLTDEGVNGGTVQDVSAGINWYMNSNTKWMLDYTWSDANNVKGSADGTMGIFALRFSVWF